MNSKLISPYPANTLVTNLRSPASIFSLPS
jgi:hypothetical protein